MDICELCTKRINFALYFSYALLIYNGECIYMFVFSESLIQTKSVVNLELLIIPPLCLLY